MSKIYEALQNAQQEIRELEKPKKELVRTSEATLLPAAADLDLEFEMITLYQNIESRLPDLEKKVIQFISAREGEGTSTIVREFARVIAKKLGKSIFLLDADQHNPRQHNFLHITPDCGWEELSHNAVAAGKAAEQSETGEDGNSKHADPISTPLNFYSPRMSNFWEFLKKRYDLILVDSAPFSLSPEGTEIARRVDGVVIVLEAEKTRWQVVENMKQKIEGVGGNIIGVVFNKRRFYIPESIYKRL